MRFARYSFVCLTGFLLTAESPSVWKLCIEQVSRMDEGAAIFMERVRAGELEAVL